MRRIEETVASVGGTTAGKLSVRKAKCNKVKFCVKCKCLVESAASRNTLCLNDTGNYYDVDSGMKLANVLYEFNNRFAGIYYRIYEYYCKLSL